MDNLFDGNRAAVIGGERHDAEMQLLGHFKDIVADLFQRVVAPRDIRRRGFCYCLIGEHMQQTVFNLYLHLVGVIPNVVYTAGRGAPLRLKPIGIFFSIDFSLPHFESVSPLLYCGQRRASALSACRHKAVNWSMKS